MEASFKQPQSETTMTVEAAKRAKAKEKRSHKYISWRGVAQKKGEESVSLTARCFSGPAGVDGLG